MKEIKNILNNYVIIPIILISLFCTQIPAKTDFVMGKEGLINVAVLINSFEDNYMLLLRKSLEEIQKEHEKEIKFTFYDGKNDQEVQNKIIDSLIDKKEVDLFLINLVTTSNTQLIINKIKQVNIPLLLFNKEPAAIDSIKSYSRCCYVGGKSEEAGLLQGNIISKLWKYDKSAIDTNKDNTLQYIMLMGKDKNLESIKESEYPILKINNSGIETKELSSRSCNWNQEEAKEAIKELFLKYGNRIEAIFANNDSMAIGAVKALQEYGYNKGDNTSTIPVIGIDAIPEARKLIDSGMMTGSVFQDPSEISKIIYNIGVNLVYNRNPLYETQYEFDETGISIRIPYHEYTHK